MTLHDPRPQQLTGLFAALLAPLVGGCAETGTLDLSQFSENLCDQTVGRGAYDVLDILALPLPVDYLAVRSAANDGLDGELVASVHVSIGEPCSGAIDPMACQTALAELPLESDWGSSPEPFIDLVTYRSMAYTRGDIAAVIRNRGTLLEFLGEIDAPGDAVLFSTFEGRGSLVCDEGNELGLRGDDFLLHVAESDCFERREHVLVVRPDGSTSIEQSVVVEEFDNGCETAGRLPAGWCRRRATGRDAVGRYWAEMAGLEAAAVAAFEQLTAELRHHGAPRSLVRSAGQARHEEVRHARDMARIARRHGGTPRRPEIRGWTPRSLSEIAVDNVAEGCVRETFGAAVAHLQAARTHDPRLRAVLGRIAREETRHAALSWDLDRWLRARMSRAERNRLDRRARIAVERLQDELTRPLPDAVLAATGLPDPDEARVLLRRLHAALA